MKRNAQEGEIMLERKRQCKVCSVCTEKMNQTTRKLCKCPTCEFEVCRACSQRYFESQNAAPRCMNCKTAFELKPLMEMVSRKFWQTTCKVKLQDALFLREQQRLEESAVTALTLSKNRLTTELKELKKKQRALKQELLDVQVSLQIEKRVPGSMQTKLARKASCPRENCRGYVDDSWSCVACRSQVCRTCMADLTGQQSDEHKCNDQDIASVQLIQTDSKPCPACFAPVHRISGCNNMFCTACKTAFSWATGAIYNTANGYDNPHYDDYARDERARARVEFKRDVFDYMPLLNKINGVTLFTPFPAQRRHPFWTPFLEWINVLQRTPLAESEVVLQDKLIKLQAQFLGNKIPENVYKTKVMNTQHGHDKMKKLDEIRHSLGSKLLDQVLQLNQQIMSRGGGECTAEEKVSLASEWIETLDRIVAEAETQCQELAKLYGVRKSTIAPKLSNDWARLKQGVSLEQVFSVQEGSSLFSKNNIRTTTSIVASRLSSWLPSFVK